MKKEFWKRNMQTCQEAIWLALSDLYETQYEVL